MKPEVLLDPTYIRDNVDYSFGDQSGAGLFNGYMKTANSNNDEFMEKYRKIKESKDIMTLFIDNIRLYQRPGIKYTALEQKSVEFRKFKDNRVAELSDNDLLKLCSELPDMKFIIFTAFEDTPIDEEIVDKIPDNVLGIYASNSQYFGGKVVPIPYGIQRKLHQSDSRHDTLKFKIDERIDPEKLLYINHSLGTNPRRIEINNHFNNFDWCTVSSPKSIGPSDYSTYLNNIKKHKFMICPDGNAIGCECHRDWEVLYMRRVPVLERSEYLEKIFDGIPVLFVDSFFDVTKELLEQNENLYDEMQILDLCNLDMKLIYESILKQHGL